MWLIQSDTDPETDLPVAPDPTVYKFLSFFFYETPEKSW